MISIVTYPWSVHGTETATEFTATERQRLTGTDTELWKSGITCAGAALTFAERTTGNTALASEPRYQKLHLEKQVICEMDAGLL